MEADLPNNVEDAFVYRFQKRGRSVGRSVGRVAWLGLAPRREEKDGRPGPLEEEMFSEMEAKANDTHGNVFIHQT